MVDGAVVLDILGEVVDSFVFSSTKAAGVFSEGGVFCAVGVLERAGAVEVIRGRVTIRFAAAGGTFVAGSRQDLLHMGG
jgi:hypothetical protein|tara:strand:+ start:1433 stop:1669 length:237 start_codon:yes stop_codon:yes gene_type:complete